MNTFCRSLLVSALLMCGGSSFAQVLFLKHMIDANFNGACSVVPTCIDGDSLVDVVATAWDGNTVAWWKNRGGNPISWTKYGIDSMFAGASYVHAADIDGDGDVDVVGSAWDANAVAWWRNDGGAPVQWVKQTITNSFPYAHEVYAVDIDRDGDTDVLGAAAGSHEIALWRNDRGNPIVWTKQTLSQSFAGARSVFAALIDGDSLLDVVGAAFSSDDIAWWQNMGGVPIVWVERTIDGSFDGAHQVRTADIDGDGDADVVGAAYMGNEIAVWFNNVNQQGQWTKQTVDANCYGALGVCAIDLDRDHRADVLGTSDLGDDVISWLNHGGSPITWIEFTIDGTFDGAWPVTAIDLDRDGDLDILSCAYNADDLAWWENNLPTGVEDARSMNGITSPRLLQNFPNPFNPTTRIDFQLPLRAFVSVKVYDILGRDVATLLNEQRQAGSHFVSWDASGIAGGVYLCRLYVDGYVATRRMVLLR